MAFAVGKELDGDLEGVPAKLPLCQAEERMGVMVAALRNLAVLADVPPLASQSGASIAGQWRGRPDLLGLHKHPRRAISGHEPIRSFATSRFAGLDLLGVAGPTGNRERAGDRNQQAPAARKPLGAS
jgi:hypothetical protein